MEIQVEAGLKEAISFLENGQTEKAADRLGELFEHDLDCQELWYTNRCCVFWRDNTRRAKDYADAYEYGSQLLEDWKTFQRFISRESFVYEPALFAVQKGFFTAALRHFSGLLNEREPLRKAEIYRDTGICYKKLGDYENARTFLMEANKIYPGLASVVAELADCYALCGEDKSCKVLFREAFFIDPEDIDLDFLDSELIKYLVRLAGEGGHKGKVLQHWVPVYGVLSGILNIKRELTSQEVGRLKQNIYAMENEFKDPSCNSDILVPSLLNSYFWLIDYYVQSKENVQKINETLIKIKILDPEVYEKFSK